MIDIDYENKIVDFIPDEYGGKVSLNFDELLELVEEINRIERCRDCICLREKNDKWFCDEYQDYCINIDECGECEKNA
jgi:hypothetical protein